MSLTVVTKALSGTTTSDPLREREYKRARRQISDGIQGASIGAALLIGAVVAYLLLPADGLYYAVSLALALGGLIKLFRSIGHVVDARVGPRLLENGAPVARGSGGLSGQPAPAGAPTTRVSQRLAVDATKPAVAPAAPPPEAVSPGERTDGRTPANPASLVGANRVGTSRVSREHSSPLRKSDKELEILSKLRN